MRTCRALRSQSEYTATAAISISRQARMIRTAISPRLAIRILRNRRILAWSVVSSRWSVADAEVRALLPTTDHHRLIRRRSLHVLDDENVERGGGVLQLQPELLLHRREHRQRIVG